MRIGVVGYYGKFNSGDDAMAAVCLTELSRRLPEAQFFVPSQPLVVPSGVDVTWQPLASVWKRGLSQERKLGAPRCDAIVWGGGSLFSDLRGPQALQARRRAAEILRRKGTRLLGLGVGIGPLVTPAGRDAARALLRLFDHIVVRDAPSQELAGDLGLANVSLASDVAVLLEDAGLALRRPRETCGAEKVLGLALCDYSRHIGRGNEADRTRRGKFVAALRASDWVGWRVRLLVLHGHPRVGDLSLAASLGSALERSVACEIRHYDPNPMTMLSSVGSCDAVVSMRLHGAVYSYIAGRPFGVISYHPKCSGFAEQVGLPADAVLDSERFPSEALRALIDRLRSAGVPGLLPVAQAQDSARQGVERVVAALAGRRP